MDGWRNEEGVLTHREIAEILTARGCPITSRAVWHEERRALQKLRNDPELRQLALDIFSQDVAES